MSDNIQVTSPGTLPHWRTSVRCGGASMVAGAVPRSIPPCPRGPAAAERLLRWRCARRTGRGSGDGLGLFLLLPAGALGHEAHLHLVIDHLDDHRVARTVLQAEQLLAQRVLDDALDHASQRTRSVDLVEPFDDELLLGLVRDGEGELLGGEV